MTVTENQALAELTRELPEVRRAMVFAPHPDDEVFGCAGALVLLQRRSVKISVVIATDGSLGGTADGSSLAGLRAEESRQAAKVLGLDQPQFWNLADRSLAQDPKLSARILETLSAWDPQLIMLPAPSEIHPDHQALAEAGVAALRQLGGDRWVMFYEVSFPLSAPNLILDISDCMALKEQAMRCFVTQLKEQSYDAQIAGLNRYRSYHLGPQVISAEAYYLTRLDGLLGGLQAYFDWQIRYRHMLAEKEDVLTGLREEIAALTRSVSAQQQALAESEKAFAAQSQTVRRLEAEMALGNRARALLQAEIDALLASTSWRITAPARSLSRNTRNGLRLLGALPRIVRRQGGVAATVGKTVRIVMREGFSGLALRASIALARQRNAPRPFDPGTSTEPRPLPVPYYIDPRLDRTRIQLDNSPSLAIHIHLFHVDMLPEFSARLQAMPLPCDYYLSVPEKADAEVIRKQWARAMPTARKVVVENVPNRGRDIAPLIVQFGARLSRYEIVGHFHTKKSPHNPALKHWGTQILDLLIGAPGASGGRIAHILALLQEPASVVYPEGNMAILKDRTGWAENRAWAEQLLKKHTRISIDEFSSVEFPEGSMFWARAEAVRELLGLPLGYDDFPGEPLPADCSIAHAIERLILVFASQSSGTPYRLHQGDSIRDYREYEPQRDYRGTRVNNDIQVLSYYLPQFHPIPENDLWHGKGFTEWTKVRAATPLFRGHYQQHIPHPDLGYYLLDTPAVLKQQADMMLKAGVHGQVFYHYWFTGKLILEEPARMLLDNPDIPMPFCFCWANENWTRRWDGNEQEILLRQEYSAEDARAFIRYLIPFFRDARYIRVENRPMLFVYRPASLPGDGEYVRIWREECLSADVEEPYIVAVLTRGAESPAQFAMDGGAERVLHDWTAGAVQDMRASLSAYTPLEGSVLDYGEVASHYCAQPSSDHFTHFRSLIPHWDNTARYANDAYMVHGSSPLRFQEWLEHIIAAERQNLPADRRFVLINAWNEWAEGAHLEPDTRYGYAYLNAVGRALSGIRYGRDPMPNAVDVSALTMHLSLPGYIQNQLRGDSALDAQFRKSLAQSTILRKMAAILTDAESDYSDVVPGIVRGERDKAQFVLEVRRLALLSQRTIASMVELACANPGSVVIPNAYEDSLELLAPHANGSVHLHEAFSAPLILIPQSVTASGYKNCRLAGSAYCVVVPPAMHSRSNWPEVTTIIRFHKSSDLRLLEKALLCLAAMRECIVTPLLAVQDLDTRQLDAVRQLLAELPFGEGAAPRVEIYHSPGGSGDLRSKMLNESLRKVRTRYAAFLDYDDLLMPHAYAWLLDRLNATGKAVSFGRVFSTTCDASTGQLLERRRVYEYGYSYQDYFHLNHAPLHSFMLDLERIDLSGVIYHDDQRYLEDYLLTLQLFTPANADWESLAANHYIGDYMHYIDRDQTLAIEDSAARQEILDSPEYQMCEDRIRQLKTKLANAASGSSSTDAAG